MKLRHIPVEERFWSNVLMVENCWEWIGTRTNGYGTISIDGVDRSAHRLAWELLRGPIPAGLTIDHLCRNRGCGNPEHMEPVTNKENILRGYSAPAVNARKTHCDQGHELPPAMHGKDRRCKICQRAKMARYDHRLIWATRRLKASFRELGSKDPRGR